ncbi:hypothetical protein FYK55_04825 [Roseiconus nitratireducens]|uniref:VWFA domain-containing protein n=1 Tax=Roseiconus nitratireducens TaxID=2605748 RepID=A0A5M6DF95_9BACT|nr:hypothetical protein [Roseiconus nitratireducens]KAA5546217.1 hypothetical protein FYK55_04825 [Roseiconus nitratireducens]
MNFGPPLASIRFAGDLPLWLVVVIAALAIAAVCFLYWREVRTVAAPYRYLLPALRSAAVLLVIVILAGPIWHRRQVIGTLGRVIFAVDTSRSMSLTDTQSDVAADNRVARATRLLLGDATSPGWLESISRTHSIDVIAFSDGQPIRLWSSEEGTPIPNALEVPADGHQTDLSSPLADALAESNLGGRSSDSEQSDGADSLRKSAVVLMTDGRDNTLRHRSGRPATRLAQQLASQGTTVNTLGFGSADEPPDVGVVEVVRPQTVAAESKLAGQVVVKQFGQSDQPVTVRIDSAGETVWQETVRVPASGQLAVPFEIDVQPLVDSLRNQAPHGIDRNNEVLQLVARVETDGADYSAENNASEFRVTASTRDRRILIVDSSSRWETRYLKNLFGRDPAWQTDLVLFGPGTSTPRIERGETPGTFPSTPAAMARYDAVILGEVDSAQLTTADRDRLIRFVAAGGGLVIIDGRHGLLRPMARAEFAELMPVRYRGTATDSFTPPNRVDATAEGLEEPALGLIDQSDQLKTFWQALPPPRWSADVELSEGAESWAEAVFPNGSRSPWLATRMYGAGRVFYFASDSTWRWRYKVADRFHARFWNQLMIAAMEPPYSSSDQFVSIGTDQVDYGTDQSITVRARLRDTLGNPVPGATVDAVVEQEGRMIATVPLSVDQPTRGTYAGDVPPLPEGRYSIRIRASGFDESALLASTPVWVSGGENLELRRMSLDEDALRQVAAAGGGQYVHESDAGTMLESLRPLSSGTVVETDTVMWQTFLWFWAIIALLAAEWWCRKRAGLV